MVDKASNRSASRRTTPQSPPKSTRPSHSPPRRATRVKRSQSRDVSDSEVARAATKKARGKGRRVKTENETNGETGSNQAARKGRPGPKTKARQDLATVTEGPGILYPDLHDVASKKTQQTGSPLRVSGISGTTARTSDPAQYPSLNPQDMIEPLSALSAASDKVLNVVFPENITQDTITDLARDLANRNSSLSRTVRRNGATFQNQKDFYTNDVYIDVPDVLTTLLNVKFVSAADSGGWRPDPILYRANLATLMFSSLHSLSQSGEEDEMIDTLEHSFPNAFLGTLLGSADPSTIANYSALSRQTLQLAIEVRTQTCIRHFHRQGTQLNFDPDLVLEDVFYSSRSLKGWSVEGLTTPDQSEEAKIMILDRLRHIRQFFPTESSANVDLAGLTLEFSRLAFITELVAWSKARLVETMSQIAERGGADTIRLALDQHVKRRLSTLSGESNGGAGQEKASKRGKAKALSSGGAKVNFAVDQLQEAAGVLKVFKKSRTAGKTLPQQALQNVAVAANSIPASSLGHGVETDNWQSQIDDDDRLYPDPDQDPDQLAQHVLAVRQNLNAQINKENFAQGPSFQPNMLAGQLAPSGTGKPSLLNRQPNAERLAWDSQDSSQHTLPSGQNTTYQHATGEEDAEGEMEDPSQDEGFQQDNRPIDSSRRNLIPSRKRPPSDALPRQKKTPKRRRVPLEEMGTDDMLTGDTQAAGGGQTGNVPTASGHEQYKRCNKEAKFLTSERAKKPQTRTAWSEVETETLLNLIENHGTSWTRIKQMDTENILEHRNQVALKDKARNMKVDYIKAAHFLPNFFENVPLGKKEVDKLESLGIHYDADTGRRARD